MTEYTGILNRIGFCPGPYGPWMVRIACSDVTPAGREDFYLDDTEVRTLNGIAVTLRELVIDLCGQFPPKGIKVRIVWDEHRYGNVREAHFTTTEIVK